MYNWWDRPKGRFFNRIMLVKPDWKWSFVIGTAKDARGGQLMNCYCGLFDMIIHPLKSQCCNSQFFSRVPSRCRECFVSQSQIYWNKPDSLIISIKLRISRLPAPGVAWCASLDIQHNTRVRNIMSDHTLYRLDCAAQKQQTTWIGCLNSLAW